MPDKLLPPSGYSERCGFVIGNSAISCFTDSSILFLSFLERTGAGADLAAHPFYASDCA